MGILSLIGFLISIGDIHSFGHQQLFSGNPKLFRPYTKIEHRLYDENVINIENAAAKHMFAVNGALILQYRGCEDVFGDAAVHAIEKFLFIINSI